MGSISSTLRTTGKSLMQQPNIYATKDVLHADLLVWLSGCLSVLVWSSLAALSCVIPIPGPHPHLIQRFSLCV